MAVVAGFAAEVVVVAAVVVVDDDVGIQTDAVGNQAIDPVDVAAAVSVFHEAGIRPCSFLDVVADRDQAYRQKVVAHRPCHRRAMERWD